MSLTTITEVKKAGQLTSEYSDDEILSEIDIVEAELYSKYNLPKRSEFSIDNDYTSFYIYHNEVHEIVSFKVQVDTSVDASGFQSVGSGNSTWTFTQDNNYVTLGSDFISTYDNKLCRVTHNPKLYRMLATDLVALNLIDTISIVDGERVDTPLSSRLKNRIDRYKQILKPKSIMRSSEQLNYDVYEYISYTQTDFR